MPAPLPVSRDPYDKLLGSALRAVRRRRGLTAKQVAIAMNMPLRTLAPESLDIRADHAAAAER